MIDRLQSDDSSMFIISINYKLPHLPIVKNKNCKILYVTTLLLLENVMHDLKVYPFSLGS